MWETLKTMVLDNVRWRAQIAHLALFELHKTVRGAVLGWIWLFVKPVTYVLVFWFALSIGLRAERTIGDYPFLAWLVCGLVPWFFMSDMLGAGSNVYKRYSYLINKVTFPIAVIPTFYALSHLIIFGVSLVAVMIAFPIFGFPLTIYALQVPLITVLMFVFFVLFSFMTSPLSAISKDFANFVKTLHLPIFWLSGVIFNIDGIDIPWVQWLLAYNPVSFIVTAFRAALCEHYWIWERPEVLVPFVEVFLLMLVAALLLHHRLGREVADAL
jgi:teichoic acid transport system permease protein